MVVVGTLCIVLLAKVVWTLVYLTSCYRPRLVIAVNARMVRKESQAVSSYRCIAAYRLFYKLVKPGGTYFDWYGIGVCHRLLMESAAKGTWIASWR